MGLERYETAFNLMHKIRSVMGKRDDLYFLKGMVEYDEAYVRKATQHEVQKRLKHGKGSQKPCYCCSGIRINSIGGSRFWYKKLTLWVL
ncbi:hypothetical protein SAMN05421761_10281 [Belliella pelovolcani]|uniref:Uncharacterized protein n=1 Tax=Belliella pelovolcani TaxID=529505 RepID=A0A1N7KHH9_9BACT|nr:hypothetical protein SAMN05421761_10281 [Belliella pelovolcani]